MTFTDYIMVVLGIVFVLSGVAVIRLKQIRFLPQRMVKRINSIRKFSITLGVLLILAGVASILSPLLVVNIGSDFWILYSLGLLACLLLLCLFFLP